VLTTDPSALHSERLKMSKPDDHVILSDMISKEPSGQPFGKTIRNGSMS